MSGFRFIRHPGRWIGALIAIAILVILVFVLRVFEPDNAQHNTGNPEYPYDVQMFEDQGRDHLALGEMYDQYNSTPPTSGPHSPSPAPWGISAVELPKEVPVHNMEHGGVVVWYNCDAVPPLDSEGCSTLRDRLAGVVQPAVDDGKLVLMTPYPDMKRRIALTAWQYLDAFDEFDEARVIAFIASFECKFNPERLC